MNRRMKLAGVAATLLAVVVLFGAVTGALAQTPTGPALNENAGQMHQGRRDGAGMGIMAVDESEMHAAIAGALGMTPADFEAALAQGATPYTLALELGVDFADVQAAMAEMHAAALDRAVEAGLVTQEMAGRMSSRQMGRGQGNMSRGAANRGGGTGDCPLVTP